jgi:transcription elongation factor GreA
VFASPLSGYNGGILTTRKKMADEQIHVAQGALLLTPEGYKALQEELEHLTVVKRPDIAERIRESQQHGEFSEDNHELEEVKFEQALTETRIAELKTIFGNAQILEPDMIPTEHVGIGSMVTLKDEEFDEQFDIRIVTSIEADPNKDMVSNESPMGTAVFGCSAGEDIEVQAPDGPRRYKVVKIAK